MTALILGADCPSNPTRYDVAAIKFMMRWPKFGPDGGADWRGPGREIKRNRPGAGRLDDSGAGRMKAGREHRVPLAPRCIELLKQAKILAAGSEFVLPGRSGKKPMSNMVLLMTMRRLESDATVHVFRSAFRDWGRSAPTSLARSAKLRSPISSRTRPRPRTAAGICSTNGASSWKGGLHSFGGISADVSRCEDPHGD